MKIAKVIVDVPSHQTDKPYDYCVPNDLSDVIQKGHRVIVPFGSRKIQGFVLDVIDGSTIENLKMIERVIDVEPVLTDELLQLGQYLATSLYAFLVSCYTVMLPSLLKGKYDKQVEWIGEVSQAPELFQNQPIVNWETIVQANLMKEILSFKRQNQVKINYVVNNIAKHKLKKIAIFHPQSTYHIRKGATQQIKLLTLLQEHPTIELSKIYEQGISTATVKKFEALNWLSIEQVIDERDPYKNKVFTKTHKFILNDEQQVVFNTIQESLQKQEHRTFLLEGVTGSGKTEVYLQLIEAVIERGKTAILLVPEISLTPQMVKQFKGRFGDMVAVLHSALSQGERYDEWVKIKEHKAKIVVGARSSIFAPLENIGMIIIDEEHEATYKQMDHVKYHARDVAIWRGKYYHAPVVLGSATPALETKARAQKGVYQQLFLRKRAKQQALPSVEIVDMTKEKQDGNISIFSQTLLTKIQDRLQKKEQIVLFLNKRGYSSFVMCRDCGYVCECPNCDISTTLHMDTKTMKCHYCHYQEAIPNTCPKCFNHNMRYVGVGTQKVEEALTTIFPNISVVRMDMDTTQKKGSHEALLKKFSEEKCDVLLGTQMIAKGLDFPNITLVGVINADTMINLPDFRASEKAYQLLTQVSGRAGRGDKLGEVVIQTYNPNHYAIQLSKMANYHDFYKREMQYRYLGKYSPYYYATLLTVSSQNEAAAMALANELKALMMTKNIMDLVILGPSAKSIARIKNTFYFQILLKYKNQNIVDKLLSDIKVIAQERALKKVYVTIDVNPLEFM